MLPYSEPPCHLYYQAADRQPDKLDRRYWHPCHDGQLPGVSA